MNILGISAFYHDSAACLVQDSEIVAAAQEERFSRKKHDASFPKLAVEYCLKEAQITLKDIDVVAFYDKPLVKFERILQTSLAYAPMGVSSFVMAMTSWVKKKLWIKDLIRTELSFEKEIIFTEHHESHAASAFFPSPFQSAAILTMDGVGEWATASFAVGRDNHIQIQEELHFPHSLGLLYSAFTYYTGFKVNSGEYKVMGLAPYGEPKYKDLILKELIDLKPDGSFKMNMKYFNYPAGLTMTNHRFNRLFGAPPRRREGKLTQNDMDLARSIQEVTEEVVLRMARHVHQKTGEKNLCLAGGVALNCVANGRLLREGPFEKLWIQPAAGDAGGALGAALFAWFQYQGNPRKASGKDTMKGSYLGPEFKKEEIEEMLKSQHASYQYLNDSEIPSRVAELLKNEKVVGWFQGRMEFGPRALGGRSILGDAQSSKMQETMNLKIKFRESFRPFAPSVLEEKAQDYFDLKSESPYMLLVAQVASKHHTINDQNQMQGLEKLRALRSTIPAVTHVDYSARVQTVNRETHPLYYQLLKTMDEKYQCPVIINTSFNVRGEPVVCTPLDAYRCFRNTHMDYLMIGNFLVEKKEQREMDVAYLKKFELD